MWQRLKERLLGRRSQGKASVNVPGIVDAGDAVIVTVECDRCHEVISVRLRKSSDIQRNYDESGPAFFVRKTAVGQKCFNRIDMEIEMDGRYRPITAQVRGGKLRSAEDSARLV